MKTPDEIKKGLFVCSDLEGNCPYCPYAINGHRDPEGMCIKELANDALAYIQQLERERDAAVADLKEEMGCKRCSKYTWTEEYVSTDCLDCINKCNWEWCGVKEE